MVTIAAQIAPQRNTQYTEMVTALAPYELILSTLGDSIVGEIQLQKMGNLEYLMFDVNTFDDSLLELLDIFAMTSSYFYYHDEIAGEAGPFLKPIDYPSNTVLPVSLIETRRYRGKTNELFTQFMCNLARYSSDFRSTSWRKLTILDPLAGGGTTLFVGLVLGADVAGVEQDKKVVEGTTTFLKQYTKTARIPANFRIDKIKNVGKRSFITLDKSVRCVIGHGDTSQVQHFVNGLKRPQLIVTDLPYGIQHQAQWQEMLVSALPAWADVLADGGVLTFSWNATRFSRDDMIALVHDISDFKVLNDPPYNQLAHQVDRVIKQRDVIVARL